MKKSEKIKVELDETTSRLNELLETRKAIEGELKALQDAYIKRKKTIEQVEPTQSKLMILNSSIESLEQTKNDLQFAFNVEEVREKRAELIETAKVSAIEADAAYSAYLDARLKIDQILSGIGAEMINSFRLFVNLQMETKNILDSVEPKILFAELELPSEEMTNLVAGKARNLPNLEFGDLLMQLENRLAQRKQSEARAAVG